MPATSISPEFSSTGGWVEQTVMFSGSALAYRLPRPTRSANQTGSVCEFSSGRSNERNALPGLPNPYSIGAASRGGMSLLAKDLLPTGEWTLHAESNASAYCTVQGSSPASQQISPG